MTRTLIIGIDPGKTTGVAVFEVGADPLASSFSYGFEATSYSVIVSTIIGVHPKIVVMENFYGGIMRNAADPLKMIGVVEYICQVEKVRLVMQSPAILQAWKSRAKGMHKSPHVTSAIAHVLHYLHAHPNP